MVLAACVEGGIGENTLFGGEEGAPSAPNPLPGQSGTPESPPVNPVDNGSGLVHPGYVCDATTQSLPDPHLRRLTDIQLKNAVRAAVRTGLGDNSVSEVALSEVNPLLDVLPENVMPNLDPGERGTFSRLDQAIQQSWVEAAFLIAHETGLVLASPANISRLLPCLGSGSVEACVTSFIETFGSRVLRSPLSSEQVALYKIIYGDLGEASPDGIADVVGTMLSSPQFLYQMEHGDSVVSATTGVVALTPYELANRLAFHFWDAPPDDELWSLAENGSLGDSIVYSEQVDRLFADENARVVVQNFFAEWLMLDELPDLTTQNSDAQFRAFAGPNLPSDSLREDMRNEIEDMVEHFVWTQEASVDELLTTNAVFPRSQELASIYGVGVWEGTKCKSAYCERSSRAFDTRCFVDPSWNKNFRDSSGGAGSN